jgi:hypothetical protein
MEKNEMKNWKTWSFGILAFATAFVFSGTLSSCGSDSAASVFSKVSVSFRE